MRAQMRAAAAGAALLLGRSFASLFFSPMMANRWSQEAISVGPAGGPLAAAHILAQDSPPATLARQPTEGGESTASTRSGSRDWTRASSKGGAVRRAACRAASAGVIVRTTSCASSVHRRCRETCARCCESTCRSS
eukprot:13797651-Heterocapsa_arctica.AAC.1